MGTSIEVPDRGSAMAALTDADAELVRGMATMLSDVVKPFGTAMAKHVHENVPELPDDDEIVGTTGAAGEEDARELVSMFRAGLPPSAHETPVEALAHVRYLQRRGVGFNTVLKMYGLGYAMFRHVILNEVADRVPDPDQAARISRAMDEYSFPFLAKVTGRLAAEYGLTEGGWLPRADDAALTNPVSADAARRLREEQLAKGAWLPCSPEESHARQESERGLDAFVETIERGASDRNLGSRLKLADTRITITLADEPDLSVTLLLDRSPLEVVDGVEPDTEGRLWIASVDLNRIWAPDFYLPMAITKHRVLIEGDVRKFLRVTPILRELAETYRQITASMQTQEAR